MIHLWSCGVPWEGKRAFDMVIGEYLNSCGVHTDHEVIVWAMPFMFNFFFFLVDFQIWKKLFL